MTEADRVRAILGDSGLAWIVARLRRRLEDGAALAGALRNPRPTPAERDAFARLLGRLPRGEGLSVSVEELEGILRDAGVGCTVPAAVEVLTGALRDRVAESEASKSAWEAAHLPIDDPGWRADIAGSGLLRRLSGGDPVRAAHLARQAAAVACRLPAEGMPLAELASLVTGNAHALDAGEPLGTLVMRLVTRMGGDPSDRRAAWATVGVEVDPLSSSVLVLNVRASGGGATPAVLDACADVGEPSRLTLRQLRVLTGHPHEEVFVCENPAIVAAAADRLGARCSPIVCTEGQPRAAVRSLLRLLRGARLRYHGDFDWAGIRIANEVCETTGAEPWRMGVEDYLRATRGDPLAGTPVSARWDPALRAAMERDGRAAHEEAVLDELLLDLARPPACGPGVLRRH